MNDLLKLALDAHGGLERWKKFERVSTHLVNGGVLWPLKGQAGVLSDVEVTATLHDQWASHSPFRIPGQRTSFRANRIAIENANGEVVAERFDPRRSFAGHTLETKWDDLQLAYFAGYAMWTYLTAPFAFAMPGFESSEIEPWMEDGVKLRRLQVTFPPHIASHSAVQTFYFDKEGIMRRHDYDVEVMGGERAAHYVGEHKEFSGILVPTRRQALRRAADGTAQRDPVIVSIELSNIEFT